MEYKIDHDLHIHSQLSKCSSDPEQNKENIFKYAEDNGLSKICITDHYWDRTQPGASEWYRPQDFEHISQIKPLPQSENVRFLFGCETEMDSKFNLGIQKERYDDFDFIIIPTTHMHMEGGFIMRGGEDAAERAELWKKRFAALIDKDLPFGKIGVAHLTCPLIYSEHYLEVIGRITDNEYRELFKRAAECGIGIELNFDSLKMDNEELEKNLRVYRIAKEEGCRFYFGSDAHHPAELACAKANFEKIRNSLGLCEEDKFEVLKK